MDEEQKKLAEELLFSGEQRPSFVKQLYFGTFDAKAIFPYPIPSEKEIGNTASYLSKVEDFVKKEVNGKEIDRSEKIPDEVIQGLGKLGLLGITIPKKYGGLEMSQYAYCKASELLSRYCGSTALFVNAHQSVGLKAILLFGTEEQKNRWLPALAKGDQIAAFSLTEPNAGSDAAGIETKAIYDPKERVYRITGDKQWTTNGSIAKVLTVMAKTPVETPSGIKEKITAFIVTPDMQGFEVVESSLEKMGMKGTKTSNLRFSNVAVPEENILGPKGKGLKVCLTVLDYGRTTFGATCTGAAKYLLQRAIDHAKTRHQFNRPLSSFPLIKKKLSKMTALTQAMDAATYLTAGLLDKGQSDIMLEASILKVFASEALWTIVYETMQIFGGRSFFTDEPLERMMRDARLNMIGEGANEVLRAFIGVVGMRDVGMEIKEGLDSLKCPWGGLGPTFQMGSSLFKRLQNPHIPLKTSALRSEGKKLSKSIRQFSCAVLKLLAKHRENIVEQQLQLDRIAECAIGIYTWSAVLSKLDQGASQKEMQIGKFYGNMAYSQIQHSLLSIKKNEDNTTEYLSDMVTSS